MNIRGTEVVIFSATGMDMSVLLQMVMRICMVAVDFGYTILNARECLNFNFQLLAG